MRLQYKVTYLFEKKEREPQAQRRGFIASFGALCYVPILEAL